MYAYFDVDESTVLKVREMIRLGKAKSARDAARPVRMGLADDDGFPHHGEMNFVDNQVNPKTGTLRCRGDFPNKQELLSPGYFCRVRVPIGFPYRALLISDRAIDTDQGQKIVYVIDKDNKVEVRSIRTGALRDGLRVVTEGVKAGEQVVVSGLQQIPYRVWLSSRNWSICRVPGYGIKPCWHASSSIGPSSPGSSPSSLSSWA